MAAESLFWIVVVAAVAPLLSGLVPHRLVPEVVLLLVLGMLIGPHVLGWATTKGGVDLLRELGLSMLFLLAGYEIELAEITGRGGRRALATWVGGFALALLVVVLVGLTGHIHAEAAVAIALSSTALGTLLPILKDSGQLRTPLGAAVLNHGAYGELCPIVAMAVLLGTRGAFGSIAVLLLFAVAALLVTVVSKRLQHRARLAGLVRAGSETTAQTTVRLVVLLLMTFVVLSAVFELDVVLGAFAAGFALRRALPEGDLALEHKLEGLAFGLLVPVFFVTSGMAIDPVAVARTPFALVIFVLFILVLRGGAIFFSSVLERDRDGGRRVYSSRDSLRIALYGATGLPIIVAVTSVAVEHGQMRPDNASLLVAGGAVTVLLLPMTATLLGRREQEDGRP
jgi:Kef-type K+ transport system membrane component KefB